MDDRFIPLARVATSARYLIAGGAILCHLILVLLAAFVLLLALAAS
jgi:hypothetical protein